MKRLLTILGGLVFAVSITANLYFWRENARTTAELGRFGLQREDPSLIATLDTLRRERAFGDSMRVVNATLKASASAAVADYRRRRDSVLAAFTGRTPAPRPSLDSTSNSVVPDPAVTARTDTTSALLTGTFEACDAAIAAVEAQARSCEIRADSADARAVRAEKAAVRADSLRLSAVDSASRAIRQSARRSFWRDLKAAVIGAVAIEMVKAIVGLIGAL